MAEFPNGIFTYSTEVFEDGDIIEGFHVTDGYDEIIAIESTILSADYLNKISAEVSIRTAESVIISTEIFTLNSTDLLLNSNISTEVSTRESVNVLLNNNISTEISIRTAESVNISTEIFTLNSTDLLLNSNLSTEISNRQSVDLMLSTAIGGSGITTSTSTSITGLLKGYNNLVAQAVANTDYAIPMLTNVETLTANKNLTINDNKYQFLIASGATRNVYLPTTGLYNGLNFYIKCENINNYVLQIYNVATKILTLTSGNMSSFVYSTVDSAWRILNFNSFAENNNRIAIGSNAIATSDGSVAIGNNAIADSSGAGSSINIGSTGAPGPAGVVIGGSSSCYNGYGVAIGNGCTSGGANYGAVSIGQGSNAPGGIAMGRFCNTNTMGVNAIALGWYSKCERWGEFKRSSDNASTSKYGSSILNWHTETTNNTPTEILLNNTSAKRATVLVNSAFCFSLLCVAYCNGATKGKTIKIEGGIRRGASTVALIGTPTTTVLAEDGTTNYTITVSADDTNKCLGITVTGATGETVRWHITGTISEVIF